MREPCPARGQRPWDRLRQVLLQIPGGLTGFPPMLVWTVWGLHKFKGSHREQSRPVPWWHRKCLRGLWLLPLVVQGPPITTEGSTGQAALDEPSEGQQLPCTPDPSAGLPTALTADASGGGHAVDNRQ